MLFRRRWPTGPLRGRFLVEESIVRVTERALQTFRGPEGPHEGMVFWGGIEGPFGTFYTICVVPNATHGPGFVNSDEQAVGAAVRALRSIGLGLLAQVHSHPGDDARHSEGDDSMVLMPWEGMLSIVVPRYALNGMRPLANCGIHQFQSGRWVLCTSKLDSIQVIPDSFDLR